MLHEIGRELEAKLQALGCPLPVIDGDGDASAHKTTTYARGRIVVEHVQGGDQIGPVRSQRPTPQQSFVRVQGAKLTIYAQSTKAGAQPFEHVRVVEHALDLVLSCLDEVVRKRGNTLAFGPCGLTTPEDLEGSERWGGAVYELNFSVDRGVVKQTWKYEREPTTELAAGMIATTTKVSLANGPADAAAETACGGD